MAYSDAITNIFPTATVDATAVTIPLADLGITQAQAGNNRRLLAAIADKYAARITALPTADKPTRMSVTKPSGTSQAGGVYRQPFSITLDYALNTAVLDLAAEA